MTARALPLALLVLLVGVAVGTGLAALAHAPANDPCLDFGGMEEGTSSSSGSVELWPLATRCEYSVGSRPARSEFFGPTLAELYAWIAVATLLGAVALARRHSPLARGALAAAAVLALSGAAWHAFGANFAIGAIGLLAAPLVFAIDDRVRPPGARSRRASLGVAVALAAVMVCAILATVAERRAGIAFGVIAGALASYAAGGRPGRSARSA